MRPVSITLSRPIAAQSSSYGGVARLQEAVLVKWDDDNRSLYSFMASGVASSMDASFVVDLGDVAVFSLAFIPGVRIERGDIISLDDGERYLVQLAHIEACCGTKWNVLAEKLKV